MGSTELWITSRSAETHKPEIRRYDVLRVGNSLEEVRVMLTDLANAAGLNGLSLHPGKTKIFSNVAQRSAAKSAKHIQILGNNIEILAIDGQTKYLGRMVTFCDPHTTEISHRIGGLSCKQGHAL